MLTLSDEALERLVAHCLAAQPHEGCGLLLGTAAGEVHEALAVPNAAASALVYEIAPADLLAADRRAEALELDVVGAFHSHTHTDAWPSPTDVARAVDPGWHWVVVSLRDAAPVVRSFRIAAGEVAEEHVAVVRRRGADRQ